MALRSGHGNGAGVPRVEVLPPDELPEPSPSGSSTPTLAWAEATPEQRRAMAVEWGRRGAEAKAARSRLLRSLGLVELAVEHAFYKYEQAATAWVEEELAKLASMFDGVCGEGPASIVVTAGLQMAASRYLYDQGKQTGDAKLLGQASSLGNDQRQNALAAYELQAREAAARKKSSGKGVDVVSRIRAMKTDLR